MPYTTFYNSKCKVKFLLTDHFIDSHVMDTRYHDELLQEAFASLKYDSTQNDKSTYLSRADLENALVNGVYKFSEASGGNLKIDGLSAVYVSCDLRQTDVYGEVNRIEVEFENYGIEKEDMKAMGYRVIKIYHLQSSRSYSQRPVPKGVYIL